MAEDPSNTFKTNADPGLIDSTDGGSKIAPFAYLSLGSFVCALVLIALLLWKAELLVRLGLSGNYYYLVLLPLSVAVAVCLFGALRSYGYYRGRQFGGTLELGGPFVGAALIIIGGFLLPPPSANFSLTIYLQGEAGLEDLPAADSNYVVVDLGADRRREAIGQKGQAYFAEIPASFRGQRVNIFLESTTYELANPERKHSLNSSSLYLSVRKRPGRITGHVQDEDGKPVGGASITVAGLSFTADSAGHFECVIPGERMQPELSMQVLANDYPPWRSSVTPNANEVTVILRRQY